MRAEFDQLAPRFLTQLPSSEFPNVNRWINQVGASLLGTGFLEGISIEESASERQLLKRHRQKMWLMYGAHIVKQIRESSVDQTIALQHFALIKSEFQTVQELWDIFTSIDITDDFVWNAPNEHKLSDDAPVFKDLHAGTQWVVALVGIYLFRTEPGQKLKPERDALVQFDAQLSPVISRISAASEQWKPFIGEWTADLSAGGNELKALFVTSAHEGDFLRYQRLTETPLDDAKVTHYVNATINSVTSKGLQLFEKIEKERGVNVCPGTLKDPLVVRHDLRLKDSFVNSPDHMDVSEPAEPPWFTENKNFLLPLKRKAINMVASREEALKEIVHALQVLEGRNTSATMIMMYNDWRFNRIFETNSEYVSNIDSKHLQVGTVAGVPVHQAPFIEKNTIVVTHLAAWLELDYYPESANKGRFFAELR